MEFDSSNISHRIATQRAERLAEHENKLKQQKYYQALATMLCEEAMRSDDEEDTSEREVSDSLPLGVGSSLVEKGIEYAALKVYGIVKPLQDSDGRRIYDLWDGANINLTVKLEGQGVTTEHPLASIAPMLPGDEEMKIEVAGIRSVTEANVNFVMSVLDDALAILP